MFTPMMIYNHESLLRGYQIKVFAVALDVIMNGREALPLRADNGKHPFQGGVVALSGCQHCLRGRDAGCLETACYQSILKVYARLQIHLVSEIQLTIELSPF